MGEKILLTGEHQRALFAREAALLAPSPTNRLRFLDLAKQTEDEVREALGTRELFASTQTWRVTNLEKIRSPKWQVAAIELFTELSDVVIVSVPQEPTPAFLKKFSSPWKIEKFPLPKAVFQFLEALKTRPYQETHQLFRQAVEGGGEWGLHALLSRQVRLLMAAKSGAPMLGAPFIINKARSQAKAFTQSELLFLQHELYSAERAIKSGRTNLAWSSFIDRALGKLYDGQT